MTSSSLLRAGPSTCSPISFSGSIDGSHRLAVSSTAPSRTPCCGIVRWPVNLRPQAPLLLSFQGTAAESALIRVGGILLWGLVVKSVPSKRNTVQVSVGLSPREGPSEKAFTWQLNSEQVEKKAPSDGSDEVTPNGLSGPVAVKPIQPGVEKASSRTQLKLCTSCKHSKPLRSFQATLNSTDGVESLCRACLATLRAVRSGRELHHLSLSIEEAWAQARVCKRCGERQELRDFPRKNSRSNGVQYICRSCYAENQKALKRNAVSVENQVCKMCNIDKPAGEFYIHAQTPTGLHPHCKACTLERRRRQADQQRMSGVFLEVDKKCCRLCKEEKPAGDFHSDKRSHDGLTAMCKACFKVYIQARLELKKIDGHM